MNTIAELNKIVHEGGCAQYQLNCIAEDIYDVFVGLVESSKEKLEKEFPGFDETISELERCNSGFYKYSILPDSIIIYGSDYFRGERNVESETIPISVFVDDKTQRDGTIEKIVSQKIDSIRSRLNKKQEQENEEERRQYEALKEKFETK